jgi:ribosomal-protein-serine acetyltransferase
MATGEELLPERLPGPSGLLLRRWLPEEALLGSPALHQAPPATTAARLLTDTALTLPGITHVEIHHDKANVASAGVPRRLGFWLLAEVPDEIEAHAELGIECQWRMDYERWARAR